MYSWKPGSRIRSKADMVGKVFEQMASEGRLTAENVVEDSRPLDAPLHNEFEWNDTTAAENWRRHEARHLINSLEVHLVDKPPVRAFVKVSTADREYHQMSVVLKESKGREILLENALRELRAFQFKYGDLVELASVFAEMERLNDIVSA